MNFTEKVNCPLCGHISSEATVVRKRADIVECPECGLVYLRTRPPVSELEASYQTYHTNPGTHMRLPDSFTELRNTGLRREPIMNDILGFTGPNRGTLLDIGSGFGAFLLNARDRGFAVWGIEICRGMAEYAEKNLGIMTDSKQPLDVDFYPGTFDVVTMLHSLEHMPDQAATLNYVHRVLKPGGLFCGIVPNYASWSSVTAGDNWVWLDPVMHVAHYTPTTLQKAMFRHGFNVVKMYTATGDYDRRLLPQFPPQLAKLEQDGKGEELHWVGIKM